MLYVFHLIHVSTCNPSIFICNGSICEHIPIPGSLIIDLMNSGMMNNEIYKYIGRDKEVNLHIAVNTEIEISLSLFQHRKLNIYS